VEIRFYIDPETGEPHIHRHDVDEDEVEEVLTRPLEDHPGSEGTRVAVGRTDEGRYLRVIYVPDTKATRCSSSLRTRLDEKRWAPSGDASRGGDDEAGEVSGRLG
jgi:hypothetical protein